jgi:hypothetical protein
VIRRLLKLGCLSMLGIISVAWLYSHLVGLAWFTSMYPACGGVVLNRGTASLYYQGPEFFDKPVVLIPRQQSPPLLWKGSFLDFRGEIRRHRSGGSTHLTLRVPLWAPALACLAILCVGPLGRAIRGRRRRLRGRCESCNYDLTGNMSGVCPECGVAIKRLNSPEEALPASAETCRS